MMAKRVFESAYQWNIYGSSGRQSLGGNFTRTWRDRDSTELILAEVSITSSWLDRSKDEISFHEEDLKTEFTVTFPQIITGRQRIEELVNELAKMSEMTTPIVKELCLDTKEQSLKLYLGPPKTQGRLEQTVFEAHYSGIGFDNGKWSFGVDQSCVTIFLNELQRSLEELGRCA